MSRVVILGDVMLDVVVRQLAPLAPTSDTPSSIRVGRGGSAASVAIAIARDAHRVRFIGAAGSDDAARIVRSALEDGGVEARFQIVDASTGTVVSMVNEDGQRAMLTDRGANSRLSAEFVLESLGEAFDHLHVSGYLFLDDATRSIARAALEHARMKGRSVSVDVCSVAPLLGITSEVFLEAAAGATHLFANEEEALALAARTSLESAVEVLSERFDEVVITRGPRGALVARGTERREVAAQSVHVLDTTGAGDAATGAYLGARLNAQGVTTALGSAMAAAARVVGDLGAS